MRAKSMGMKRWFLVHERARYCRFSLNDCVTKVHLSQSLTMKYRQRASFAFCRTFVSSSSPSLQDVLSTAAEEGRRLSEMQRQSKTRPFMQPSLKEAGLPLHTSPAEESTTNSPKYSTALPSTMQHSLQKQAMDAAAALLLVTKAVDVIGPAVLRNSPETRGQVAAVHKAFLNITEWCLSLLSNSGPSIAGEHPLLEQTLALAERAHALHFPLLLPLHSRIAMAIAETGKVDTGERISQTALRLRDDLSKDAVTAEFFAGPIISLVQRLRLEDAIHVLRTARKVHNIKHYDLDSTTQILFELRNLIQPMWRKNSARNNAERDAIHIMLFLEDSIWATTALSPSTFENDADLRENTFLDTIDALISGEEDERDMDLTFENMMSPDRSPSWDTSDDEDDSDPSIAPDDIFDVDEKEVDTYFAGDVSADSAKGKDLVNMIESMAKVDGVIPKNFNVKVSKQGDFTLVQLSDSRLQSSDSESEIGDPLSKSGLANRWDIPDISGQLARACHQSELRYGPEFQFHLERHLSSDADMEDNDDDPDF